MLFRRKTIAHWSLLFELIVLGSFVAAFVWLELTQFRTEPTPIPLLLHDDLCNAAFEDRRFGSPARVVFRLPLTATADPLVWEYRPGLPPRLFAPTVRVEFIEAPPVMTVPATIYGIVNRIETDDRPRKSRHLGVVVITSARLEVPAAP